MKISLLALLIVFSSITVNADSSESVECDSATELDRGTNHNTLILGWYRMKHHELLNEDDIPGSCAFKSSPIWARGSFPDNEGDEVPLDGCVYSETNACEKIYSIKVHNCGEHNVYYLNATATADEAYCFKKDDDDDDDDDCEEQKDYGKKFHRCHRNNRYVVLVIGSVIIAGVLISMVAIYLWRRKRLAAMLKKEMYKAPQDSNGPVVVTTNDNLPPKKY